jgi:hypothetical protein
MNPKDDVDALDRSENGTASSGTATPERFFRDIDKPVIGSVRRLMDDASIGINDDFFHIGGNSILAVRIAHIVTGTGLTTAGLRGALARLLPGHLIPASFDLAGQLPWTPSEKVDRALPADPRFLSAHGTRL